MGFYLHGPSYNLRVDLPIRTWVNANRVVYVFTLVLCTLLSEVSHTLLTDGPATTAVHISVDNMSVDAKCVKKS